MHLIRLPASRPEPTRRGGWNGMPDYPGEEDGFGKEGEGTVASFPRVGSREGLQPICANLRCGQAVTIRDS